MANSAPAVFRSRAGSPPARNGHEALAAADRGAFDLVLMDLSKPMRPPELLAVVDRVARGAMEPSPASRP